MNNPFNAYNIELYLGEKRAGKDIGMVADTFEIIKHYPETKVYANFELNKKYFKYFQKITKDDLEKFYEDKEKFKKCIFMITEIHIFLDSRSFMKDGNKKIGYFLGQMGKRGNIFRGNTHFPMLVDFRLRSYCERWIYVKKGLIVNSRWKQLLNYNDVLNDMENEMLYIKCSPIIRKLIGYDFEYKELPSYLIKAKDYFDMYDTEELISGK